MKKPKASCKPVFERDGDRSIPVSISPSFLDELMEKEELAESPPAKSIDREDQATMLLNFIRFVISNGGAGPCTVKAANERFWAMALAISYECGGELVGNLNQQDIAKALGVSQSTLSRSRAKAWAAYRAPMGKPRECIKDRKGAH